MIILWSLYTGLWSYSCNKEGALRSFTIGFLSAYVLYLIISNYSVAIVELAIYYAILGIYAVDIVKLLKMLPKVYGENNVR